MTFVRHAAHRKKRLGNTWRRPRGLHNKMRLEKKGRRPPVKQGYMTAAETRDMRNGLRIHTVHTVQEIEALDPKRDGIIIGAVGMRKKILLLAAAERLSCTVFTGNPKDARERLEKRFAERTVEAKKVRSVKEKRREERKKQADAKKDEKKLEEEVEDVEEAKKKEKEEKDKVLTKAR